MTVIMRRAFMFIYSHVNLLKYQSISLGKMRMEGEMSRWTLLEDSNALYMINRDILFNSFDITDFVYTMPCDPLDQLTRLHVC